MYKVPLNNKYIKYKVVLDETDVAIYATWTLFLWTSKIGSVT